MTRPVPIGLVDEPNPAEYTPREIGDEATAAQVAGAQELLAWARAHGFAVQSIKVGAVELVNVIDGYPRRRAGHPGGQPGEQHEE